MSGVRRLSLAVAIAALAVGGCATAGAKARQPEPVALDVPAPPPRVIVPPEPEPEPEAAQAPAPVPEPEARIQKPSRRPTSATPARPDPKTDSARTSPSLQSGATLQQALPASPADVVHQVRDRLAQAQNDLRRVDYLALSTDGRSQYDTAKRFIEQAEQALREQNLVFAATVAEKAAGLAASLIGRIRS